MSDAIDLHDIGAGFGHDPFDHGHDHALVARVPDDPVERRRRDREGHDGIRAGRDHRVHLLNLLLRVGARGLDPELHPIAVLRRPGHGDDGVLRFRLPRVADIAHAVIDEVLSVLGLCLGLVGSHAGGERYAHADGHRGTRRALILTSPSLYVWLNAYASSCYGGGEAAGPPAQVVVEIAPAAGTQSFNLRRPAQIAPNPFPHRAVQSAAAAPPRTRRFAKRGRPRPDRRPAPVRRHRPPGGALRARATASTPW